MKNLKALSISLLSFAIFGVATLSTSNKVEAADDKSLSDCFSHGIKTMGDFCINTYVDSLETLECYRDGIVNPANMIFTIDGDLNLLNRNGDQIGIDLSQLKEFYLNEDIIPCVYIKDSASKDAFVTYWSDEWNKYDVAVVCSDSNLLLETRKSLPILRGILDVSERNLTKDDFGALVGEVQTSRANTLIVNKSIANKETFDYFQARFKTVWVDDTDASEIELVNHITKGAYGVIVNEVQEAIDTLEVLNNSVHPQYNYNRPVFNIAHRGLCRTNYENSLEGCIEAYEKGATHFEIDIQVTKDNKLAIMHDDTIERTTTGTGKISDYTAEELKAFKIIKSYAGTVIGDGVAIPMLDDIFNYFKGKEIVIIVEIKTAATNCVSLLKDYIEAADIASQVVVISFYSNQLVRMRDQIPAIPCADLNTYNAGSFSSTALKALNTGNYIPDSNYGSAYSSALMKIMADRGYAAYLWTFENLANCFTGIKNGIVGLTNNIADEVGAVCPVNLEIPSDLTVASLDNLEVEAYAINYVGERCEKTLTATPLIVSSSDTEADVIFQAKFNSGSTSPKLVCTIFSDVVKVKIGTVSSSSSQDISSSNSTTSNSGSGETTSNNGCGGAIGSSIVISLIALPTIICLLKGRRKDNE